MVRTVTQYSIDSDRESANISSSSKQREPVHEISMPDCRQNDPVAIQWSRESAAGVPPSSEWARTESGRLCRRRVLRAEQRSAVRRVWSNSVLIESMMHACAVTLDARDLARLSCTCKEAFKARWPWPCPFLRCPVSKNSLLDDVPHAALTRLAAALERPRRSSVRLSDCQDHKLDAWVGRGERSFRSALAISVVAHCSATNRRAVGQTVSLLWFGALCHENEIGC